MAKQFAKSFYSSKAWQDCRNEYAKKVHHLCENCLKQGIYKPGEIVHHKIEITPMNITHPEITLNHKNLQLLCRDCHAAQHRGETGWMKYNKARREKKIHSQRFVVDENGKVFGKNEEHDPLRSDSSNERT